MTDDFDVSLRRRLESLASSVPVSAAGEIAPVTSRGVRAGSSARLGLAGWLPVLALVVGGLLVAGISQLAPRTGGPRPSDSTGTGAANGPIEASTRSGDFVLIIRSASARYSAADPILIEASLIYDGDAPLQIGHALGARQSPLGFGIEEPVLGGLRLEPASETACTQTSLDPGQSIDVAFAKSAGWDGTDPRSDEYRAFVLDPVLWLEEGTWHVYAVAEFSLGGCDPELIRMRADLAIDVVASPRGTPDPTVPTESKGAALTPSPSSDPREPTAPVPSHGPAIALTTVVAPSTACMAALGGGVLASNPRTGLGFADESGNVVDVTWPYGFTAHEDDGLAALVDASGRTVAREGDPIRAGGGSVGGEDTFIACDLDPWSGTPISLSTAPAPEQSCQQPLRLNSGALMPNERTGLGISGAEGVAPVRWPFGYSARDVHGFAVLFDARDQVVAWQGRLVAFSGPSGPDGTIVLACGEVGRGEFRTDPFDLDPGGSPRP